MATRKSSSTRPTVAPAAPCLPILHQRQAEAQEAVATIQYGLRLTAVLMRAPGQEHAICGIEIAHTVRALVGSMEQAVGRIAKLLLPESKDAEAREAAARG